jgi:hypothetical protein
LTLLLAGGGACAEVDAFVGGGPIEDAAAGGYDSGPESLLSCVDPGKPPPDFRKADVLILLDRSGSMDTAYGDGTRHQAVATILSDLVTNYAARVRFGYQEMPGRQGCGTELAGGCCASPPLVAIADGNTRDVTAAIASAQPMDGNTPTAASLQAALSYFETLADGIDNRFVLLATDGAPNCTLAGALSSGVASDATTPACAEALSAVSALVASGVRVIVLAVGPDLVDDTSGSSACLDPLAHVGGAAVSPGNPGFYPASDPQQLQLVIEQLFGGTSRPSCSVELSRKVKVGSILEVWLDGRQIPRDGWQLDSSRSPPTAIITGRYCDQIRRFQVTKVEVRYDCIPYVEGSEIDP